MTLEVWGALLLGLIAGVLLTAATIGRASLDGLCALPASATDQPRTDGISGKGLWAPIK